MNESSTVAPLPGGTAPVPPAPTAAQQRKQSKISEAVIRIAGNSQDGIQAIGGFLARLAGRSEQEVMTFMTITSTISGGPSLFQVRIGSGEVLSSGDEADVLLSTRRIDIMDGNLAQIGDRRDASGADGQRRDDPSFESLRPAE